MNWWQNLFISSSKHLTIKSTGQINATHIARNSELPVVVAPVTGQLQKIVVEKEQLNHRNGFMMIPNGNNLMSPVSGIVIEANPRAVTIQNERYGKVVVQVISQDHRDVRLAAYGTGQQLHAGDLIGAVRQAEQPVQVYVLFEDQVTPNVNYGAVYAGQNIWRQQEATNDEE